MKIPGCNKIFIKTVEFTFAERLLDVPVRNVSRRGDGIPYYLD